MRIYIERDTRMKPSKRILMRITVAAGSLVLAVCALSMWQKHDFCQGWASHYAARAKQLRVEADQPGLTRDERREHLIAADWHDVISRKYAQTARQPWRAYPSAPLITPEERGIAAAKH
jgi:hypothetical protein